MLSRMNEDGNVIPLPRSCSPPWLRPLPSSPLLVLATLADGAPVPEVALNGPGAVGPHVFLMATPAALESKPELCIGNERGNGRRGMKSYNKGRRRRSGCLGIREDKIRPGRVGKIGMFILA